MKRFKPGMREGKDRASGQIYDIMELLWTLYWQPIEASVNMGKFYRP